MLITARASELLLCRGALHSAVDWALRRGSLPLVKRASNPFTSRGRILTGKTPGSRLSCYLMIAMLLSLAVGWNSGDGPPSHDSAFTAERLLSAQASALKSTVVAATLTAPLEKGKNVMWCGTFQLAWNAACDLVGEDLHFIPEPPVVAELNQRTFVKSDLDEASYVALADYVGRGIHGKITQALQERFKGAAAPRSIPSEALTPRPHDIVAYAYLFKNLEFATPFEQLDSTLWFGKQKVRALGMDYPKFAQREMAQQVLIWHYQGSNNFVIELKSKSEGDRVILAKIQPKATLAATVAEAQIRSNSGKPEIGMAGDELAIPKFNFDITQEYNELEGHLLVLKNPQVARDLQVQSAMQDLRFQMDERGARLRSDAHLALSCGVGSPPIRHVLFFDKPFLVMMEREKASAPYFALWVNNTELLETN